MAIESSKTSHCLFNDRPKGDDVSDVAEAEAGPLRLVVKPLQSIASLNQSIASLNQSIASLNQFIKVHKNHFWWCSKCRLRHYTTAQDKVSKFFDTRSKRRRF